MIKVAILCVIYMYLKRLNDIDHLFWKWKKNHLRNRP